MSNTYTWIIDSLDVTPSINGKNNVVSCIHWRLIADDGITPTSHNAMIYGTQSFTYTLESEFIAYANLTEQTVINWLESAIGQEQITIMKSILDSQIVNIINPPVVNLPLPW